MEGVRNEADVAEFEEVKKKPQKTSVYTASIRPRNFPVKISNTKHLTSTLILQRVERKLLLS
jgi:hypothetical protein